MFENVSTRAKNKKAKVSMGGRKLSEKLKRVAGSNLPNLPPGQCLFCDWSFCENAHEIFSTFQNIPTSPKQLPIPDLMYPKERFRCHPSKAMSHIAVYYPMITLTRNN